LSNWLHGNTKGSLQALPWILDVGYTVLAVSILIAVMGHILFGDFESTMTTLPDSISGDLLLRLRHCPFVKWQLATAGLPSVVIGSPFTHHPSGCEPVLACMCRVMML